MPMVNYTVDGELYHHGIEGQKWGDRNYQYQDGSLTPEGRRRYYGEAGKRRFRFGDAKSKIIRVSTKAKDEVKAKVKAKVKEYNSEEGKKERRIKKLVNKKIKNYDKYTEEEIREAANRKASINKLKSEKTKDTPAGRTKEYLDSPAGQKMLETVTKTSIEQLGKIASTSANAFISKYLDKNAKEIFEKRMDRKGWNEKNEISKEKLKEELNKIKLENEKIKAETETERNRSKWQNIQNKKAEEKNTQNTQNTSYPNSKTYAWTGTKFVDVKETSDTNNSKIIIATADTPVSEITEEEKKK